MKSHTHWTWVCMLCLLCGAELWAQQADSAQAVSNTPNQPSSVKVPRLVKFSGVLRDLTGKPLAGPMEVNFAIYKEQGDAAPLWQETQTLALDEQGRYTVLLGAMQGEGLPMELFATGEARWLAVQAPGAETPPRVLLVSVPYALKAADAETLGGKPASAFVQANNAESAASTPAGGALTTGASSQTGGQPKSSAGASRTSSTSTGTLNVIAKFLNATSLVDSAIYEANGSVGIGTHTPAATLDIAGMAGNFRVAPSGAHLLFTRPGSNYIQAGSAGGGLDFVVNGDAPLDATSALRLAPTHDVLVPNGRLGVGTLSPAATLDIAGSAGNFQVASSGVQVRFTRPGANYVQASSAGGWLDFVVNGDASSDATSALKLAPNHNVLVPNGSVGIGTTTPAARLGVSAGSGQSGIQVVNPNDDYLGLMINNAKWGATNLTGFGFWQGNDGSANLDVNGQTWLTIATSGKVGIGTNPLANLNIQNTQPGAYANTSLFQIKDLYNSGAYGQLLFLNGYGSGGVPNGFNFTNDWGAISIGSSYSGSPLKHDLVISNGNVGVGTLTPGAKLEVAGNLKLSGTGSGITFPDGSTQSSANTFQNGLVLTGQPTNQIQFTGAVASGRVGQDDSGLFAAADTQGTSLRFATNNGTLTERMRITSDGKVGIGTSTPANTLDVLGSARVVGGDPSTTGEIAFIRDDQDSVHSYTGQAGSQMHFRLSRAKPDSDSVGKHFLITPYTYGTAIEYKGTIEVWSRDFSVHMYPNWGESAYFWVGDETDSGGLFATAHDSGDSLTSYAVLAADKFAQNLSSHLSHGSLHFQVRNVTDAFRFQSGLWGSTVTEAQIGTETSATNFDVFSGTVQGRLRADASTGAVQLGSISSHRLDFFTGGGAPQMTVLTNGQVGIGTTAPTAALEVNGGVRLNTASTQPVCGANARGTFWVTQGASGVSDTVQICVKGADDSYGWKTVSLTP